MALGVRMVAGRVPARRRQSCNMTGMPIAGRRALVAPRFSRGSVRGLRVDR
jgi:hypothetical protein